MAPRRLTPQIATREQVAGVESVPEAPALQEVNSRGAEGRAGDPSPSQGQLTNRFGLNSRF